MNYSYIIPNRVQSNDLKEARKKINLTQKEFAELVGCSKPTIERYERSDDFIEGPIAILVNLINNEKINVDDLILPSKKYPLRLHYMHNNTLCTIIDVDDINQKISIINYSKNIMFRAFGINDNPTYNDYNDFLKSRCFPETRDKLKLVLKDLNLPFYDPFLIIEKTEGRMAEDNFWIKIER